MYKYVFLLLFAAPLAAMKDDTGPRLQFRQALYDGNVVVLNALLARGFDLNNDYLCDDFNEGDRVLALNYVILHLKRKPHVVALVDFLLHKGASPYKPDWSRFLFEDPLFLCNSYNWYSDHTADQHRHTAPLTKLLLAARAASQDGKSFKKMIDKAWSLLDCPPVYNLSSASTRLFLEHGADPNAEINAGMPRGGDGDTPLHLVGQRLVDELREINNPELSDGFESMDDAKEKITPLVDEIIKIIAYLLLYGADHLIENYQGEIPFEKVQKQLKYYPKYSSNSDAESIESDPHDDDHEHSSNPEAAQSIESDPHDDNLERASNSEDAESIESDHHDDNLEHASNLEDSESSDFDDNGLLDELRKEIIFNLLKWGTQSVYFALLHQEEFRKENGLPMKDSMVKLLRNREVGNFKKKFKK